MINVEQKVVLDKIDELKRELDTCVAQTHETHFYAEDERIDSIETFYDKDKTKPHKYCWYNHKNGACGYCEYAENGPEKETANYYADGQLILCRFNNRGVCCYERGYKNGLLNGGYSDSYPDGQVQISGRYMDGLKEDQWLTYYPNGQLKEEAEFYDDVKDGFCTSYYPNGEVKNRCCYAKGRLDGGFDEYYENGNIKIICFYKDGNLDGKFERYDENGDLSFRAQYDNGIRVDEKPRISAVLNRLKYGTMVPPVPTINGAPPVPTLPKKTSLKETQADTSVTDLTQQERDTGEPIIASEQAKKSVLPLSFSRLDGMGDR